MRVAHVIVDIAAREIDRPFDYLVPEELAAVEVGSCVLVDFAHRPAVAYIVGFSDESVHTELKAITTVLGGPYFDERAASVAQWIAEEYVCALSDAVKLFAPPGGTPRAVLIPNDDGTQTWILKRPGVGPVDDRWVWLADAASSFKPRAGATTQRAVIDALAAGPLRVAELTADLGSVDAAVRSLVAAGVLNVERRRRMRSAGTSVREAPRHERLSDGQQRALDAIASREGTGEVIVLDGVTGSGKTEVYLRAIEGALVTGGTACVLVPEISLTPQTVGRFRSRFGDDVAVLHSRLSPGERLDQWDMIHAGDAKIVVGARSALFAPLRDLRLIIIDEEHESSYKQGSTPRYHTRDVAARMAAEHGAVLVLGSASPSMETRHRWGAGDWTHVELPERVTGHDVPDVQVVDLADEFARGNRSMFSSALTEALVATRERGEKAVLFLNRRGFASFLLCRECGYVPMCDSCSTSMTYHETISRLVCHHCGAQRPVPSKCPRCQSPYLRQFGAGTQRVEAEVQALVGEWPVVRMDADTTKGKGSHERNLLAFEALESGVLLGTQMIAKGLDYPEVTLVGVISADVTLNVPDFRAGERTYQLLEQVAGRAGRGSKPGQVIVQTYWPDHPAILAAASHTPALFYDEESSLRASLGYPPFGRLANVLVRGRNQKSVAGVAQHAADAISREVDVGWQVLGPSPSPLSRVKGVWRWHVLLKAPEGADVSTPLCRALRTLKKRSEVAVSIDVDPSDLL